MLTSSKKGGEKKGRGGGGGGGGVIYSIPYSNSVGMIVDNTFINLERNNFIMTRVLQKNLSIHFMACQSKKATMKYCKTHSTIYNNETHKTKIHIFLIHIYYFKIQNWVAATVMFY